MTAEINYTTIELFKKVAEGDERAFKSLFDTYWPQVYGTTLRLTRLPEGAKDLAQDIFVRLWENRTKLKEVQNPESYIYILSRNFVMDYLRKKVFDPANLDFLISYFKGDGTTPQDKMEYKELENTLRDAIDTLPGKIKEVFQLSRFGGLTHEQIAVQLNISVVSSKTYIVRALQKIREYLASHSKHALLVLIACALLVAM